MDKSERDTHFLGYAELVEQRVNALFADQVRTMESGVIYSGAEFAERLRLIYAQCGYDLVYHALDNIWEVHNPKALLDRTPDLTEWPPSSITVDKSP